MNHQSRTSFMACQTPHFRSDDKDNKTGKEKKLSLMESVDKLGRGIKESLSPKQKGDWKDLLLMSLSFAIYIYISQKIVCAYCAWTSVFKHHW